MDANERIQAHILSVWRQTKKFFSIGGKEGMLFLTDRHLMFITKTEAKMKWWQAATQRQAITLLKSKNVMSCHDGYNEENLRLDLQNKKNLEVDFDNILSIDSKEKSWGGVLNIELNENGERKKYQFSIVLDWVKYPAKDPTKFMKVDWSPLVQYIKERQKITK
ncbi:MAG: hypothetical protein WD154_06540 [Nitrosopumilaceae archaeon]